jgi:hypothetical protein
MNYRISIALLVLAAAAPAFAHDQLPNITACTDAAPITIGTFGFKAAALREYRICMVREAGNPWLRSGSDGSDGSDGNTRPTQPPVCRVNTIPLTMVVCPAKTCGQFDDDYKTARALALSQCSSYIGPGTAYPANTVVIPIFSGPETFLDPNHHQLYKSEDGVAGECVVCPEKER